MDAACRQFTDEFKREAVGLLATTGRPLSQIAQELGIAPSRLRAWRDAGSPWRSDTQAAIPHPGVDLAAENARLRAHDPTRRAATTDLDHDQLRKGPVGRWQLSRTVL
ncbi:MAG TPA: transposase [Chloroflexota bacterium]|jgi:transposase|nr:transposase [Chloroflexota bacterium]